MVMVPREMVFKGDLVNFISTNCGVGKLFHRMLQIKISALSLHTYSQSGYAMCITCQKFFAVKCVTDLYAHLYEDHRITFIKYIIGSNDVSIYHPVDDDKITFVKEEVASISYLRHYLTKSVSSITDRIKHKMIKKVHDIFTNRHESKSLRTTKSLMSYLKI